MRNRCYHCHCHLKRVVRDDPEFSDFWQRFDDTDGELDTANKQKIMLMQSNPDADNYADAADA